MLQLILVSILLRIKVFQNKTINIHLYHYFFNHLQYYSKNTHREVISTILHISLHIVRHVAPLRECQCYSTNHVCISSRIVTLIIRTVLCCTVYYNCTQLYAHL